MATHTLLATVPAWCMLWVSGPLLCITPAHAASSTNGNACAHRLKYKAKPRLQAMQSVRLRKGQDGTPADRCHTGVIEGVGTSKVVRHTSTMAAATQARLCCSASLRKRVCSSALARPHLYRHLLNHAPIPAPPTTRTHIHTRAHTHIHIQLCRQAGTQRQAHNHWLPHAGTAEKESTSRLDGVTRRRRDDQEEFGGCNAPHLWVLQRGGTAPSCCRAGRHGGSSAGVKGPVQCRRTSTCSLRQPSRSTRMPAWACTQHQHQHTQLVAALKEHSCAYVGMHTQQHQHMQLVAALKERPYGCVGAHTHTHSSSSSSILLQRSRSTRTTVQVRTQQQSSTSSLRQRSRSTCTPVWVRTQGHACWSAWACTPAGAQGSVCWSTQAHTHAHTRTRTHTCQHTLACLRQ